MVSIYATDYFNNVQVTVPSGETPFADGFELSPSHTELVYSTGSTSGSGYGYGGYVKRTTMTSFVWDLMPLWTQKMGELA